MRKLLPIENEPSFRRDETTSALINTDVNLLAEFKNRRRIKKEMQDMKMEINMLKDELQRIKNHLNLGN